jgi:hypothetical protein
MIFNPALNVDAFKSQSELSAPPQLNALYLRDGQYDGMSRGDVAATFAAFRAQTNVKRLALFFHGGLVDKRTGQQGAANEYVAYSPFVFPLFFIWESGIWELLSHHLPLIFSETIFGRVVAHATTIVSAKIPRSAEPASADDMMLLEAASASISDADRAKVELTGADIDAFMLAIKNDEIIQQEAAAVVRSSQGVDSLFAKNAGPWPSQLSPRTHLSPEVVSAMRGAYAQASVHARGAAQTLDALSFNPGGAIQAAWAVAKAAVPVIVNCVKRFLAKRDHGITCTVVEEVLRALYLANAGSAIWEEMKQETENAFDADSGRYGGTAVVEELCALLKQQPAPLVTLVGHSTGAIYIGNFLDHVDAALTAQGDTATSFDIILMAPASTVDFHAMNYTRRVRGIRIFQMTDSAEQQDHLMSRDSGPDDRSILGRVYPRSLLYLVSGICEYFEGQGGAGRHVHDGDDMPILGMARFWDQTAIFPATDYPNLAFDRSSFVVAPPVNPTKFIRVLSPTAAAPNDGFRSTATKHGNFPGDAPTMASIQLCFQNGL